MRRFVSTILFALILTVSLVGTSSAAPDYEREYILTIGDHYNVAFEDVHDVVLKGIKTEEIPVVFYIAKHSYSSSMEIAKARLEGQSWNKIAHHYGLNGASFHVLVVGNLNSPTFEPILDKYRETLQADWANISLTNSDIVNLVNLKMINTKHNYPPMEVIGMRDGQHSFPKINNTAIRAKHETETKRVAQTDK